jgi:hypothetical protein
MEEGCGNDWVTPPSDQEMPAVNAEGNGQLELPLRTLGCGSVSPLTLDDNQQYPAPLHSLPATDATFNDQHPIEHATTATLSAHSATNSETPIKQEPCIKEEPRIQQESPIRQEPRIKQESRDPSSSPYPSALKLLRLHARFGSAKKMNNMDTEIKIDAGSGSSTGKLTFTPSTALTCLDYSVVDLDAVGAAAYNHTGPYGNMDPITIDAAPDTYSQDVSLRGEVTARGRGTVRGRGSARARGMSVPRGRGGIYRATRRTRSQLDDEELEDEDEDATPRRKGKKRQKAGPEPDSYLQPTEIHRRKVSLRDRLIRGEYEPQAVGMRAHMLKKGQLTPFHKNPSHLSSPITL